MTLRSRRYPLRSWLIETWLIRISLLSQAPGTARYSPEPKSNVLSPRWISAALLTIATRRSDNFGPITNGVVSNAGQGILPTPRVGSGMSSRRAMQRSPLVNSAARTTLSARGRQLVLGFRLEVAGIVPLVQLARWVSLGAIDHTAAFDRRTAQDHCGRTLDMFLFSGFQEFGRPV